MRFYLGGRHFATGTPDRARFGNLAYPPVFADLTVDGSSHPELRIDGYVGKQQVASVRMSADTSRDRLALTADHPAIQADGTDTTRLTFRAVDAYGNQRPHVTGDVTLSLTGPGQLDGDNPFPLGILRRHRRRLPPLDPRPRRHGDRHRQPRQARLQHDQRDDNPACTQPETRPVSDGCAIPPALPATPRSGVPGVRAARRLGSTYSIGPAGPHAGGSTRRHHRSETSLTKTLSAPVSCVGS